MQDFTTTGLIASVRRKATLPSTSALNLTDSDIINIAQDEVQTTIVPLMTAVREEIFVRDFTYTIIPNQLSYALPPNTVAMSLRMVAVVDSQQNFIPIPRLDPATFPYLQGIPMAMPPNSPPAGFFLQDNAVILSPAPAVSSLNLLLKIYRRPNDLIPVSQAAQILSINTGTGVITFTAPRPSNITTSTPVDFISYQTPFGPRAESITVTATGASTITVATSDIPSTLIANDWVAVSGDSPIPQLMREAHPLLYQAAAIKCLEAIGDRTGMAVMQEKYEILKKDLEREIQPRIDGNPEQVVNVKSPFRRSYYGRLRWY